jgi:hypothetical protein
LALLPDVLRKFAGSGGTPVLAGAVSTGSVAARLNMARRTPAEQRAKASKTRGLKIPASEVEFFCMRTFAFLSLLLRFSARNWPYQWARNKGISKSPVFDDSGGRK